MLDYTLQSIHLGLDTCTNIHKKEVGTDCAKGLERIHTVSKRHTDADTRVLRIEAVMNNTRR